LCQLVLKPGALLGFQIALILHVDAFTGFFGRPLVRFDDLFFQLQPSQAYVVQFLIKGHTLRVRQHVVFPSQKSVPIQCTERTLKRLEAIGTIADALQHGRVAYSGFGVAFDVYARVITRHKDPRFKWATIIIETIAYILPIGLPGVVFIESGDGVRVEPLLQTVAQFF